MTTDEGTDLAPSADGAVDDTEDAPALQRPDDGERRATSEPRFWHSSHPVFTPLAGFFTGTLLVVLVLGILGLVLNALFDVEISEHPGPFLVAVLSLFVLNVVLLVARRTRRFARYMLLGLIGTPVVVAAVAALTVLVLVKTDA